MASWVYIGSELYPPGQEFVRVLDVSTANCTFPDSVSIKNYLLCLSFEVFE